MHSLLRLLSCISFLAEINVIIVAAAGAEAAVGKQEQPAISSTGTCETANPGDASTAEGSCASVNAGDSNYQQQKQQKHTSVIDAEYECVDNKMNCAKRAAEGHCEIYPKFMLRECQKSCGVCGNPTFEAQEELFQLALERCIDEDEEQCPKLAEESNFCTTNTDLISKCRKSCGCCIKSTSDFGVEQLEGDRPAMARLVMRQSLKYMHNLRNSEDAKKAATRNCQNKNEWCSHWASLGRCAEAHVMQDCLPACMRCVLFLN